MRGLKSNISLSGHGNMDAALRLDGRVGGSCDVTVSIPNDRLGLTKNQLGLTGR